MSDGWAVTFGTASRGLGVTAQYINHGCPAGFNVRIKGLTLQGIPIKVTGIAERQKTIECRVYTEAKSTAAALISPHRSTRTNRRHRDDGEL